MFMPHYFFGPWKISIYHLWGGFWSFMSFMVFRTKQKPRGYDCSKDLTPTPDGGGPSFWNSMTIGGASLSNDNIQLKSSWVFDGSYILKMWNEFANTNHIDKLHGCLHCMMISLFDDTIIIKKREKPCLMLHYLAWSACLCKREAASKKPKTYKAHNAIPIVTTQPSPWKPGIQSFTEFLCSHLYL